MASVTSLDKDLRKMRLDKYTPQAANEVREWIEGVLGERLAGGDLLEALKDGVALCKLINLAVGPPGVKYKASRMPFVQMENISHFLRACQAPPLNLQPHDVFLTVDLYEQKDPAQVLQCISAFSRVANKAAPSKFPSVIGLKARGGMVSPQVTGQGLVGGGSYGGRTRGTSFASNGSSSAINRSEASTPGAKGDASGRWSPSKPVRPTMSPVAGNTSSWSRKQDEGVTSPAWNIAQYGYMGGASQGNMGVSFGARRQITSAGPHVPSMAEKEKRRKEQEAEEERMRLALEEQERREQEAEEERAKREEQDRWEEEERKLKAKAAEEKRKWEEDERKWKQEEERRQKEEREALALFEKEKMEARRKSDARLQGQFLSQYQAEQKLGRRERSKSPGPSGRVKELERELELARERERQYERERQERIKARNHQSMENHDLQARMKEDTRSKTSSRKNSQDSWVGDEREYLRKEWAKAHREDQVVEESREETPPPMPPRHQEMPPPMLPTRQQKEDVPPAMPPRMISRSDETDAQKSSWDSPEKEPVRLVKNHTGPSSRPLPNPAAQAAKSKSPAPPPAKYQSTVPSVDGASGQQNRTGRFLASNPAPQESAPRQTYASELGAFDTTAEQDAEASRRIASQKTTKAGGWASKSLLEREMEMERQRQREWEEGQKLTAEAAKRGGPKQEKEGEGVGGRWDVNQWTGYTGGDGQNRGTQGIGAGRRQIVGPRPPPGR